MKKKILFLMLATFALASCNDDCDHGFDGGGINSDILVGSWYEETQNEEDTYSSSSAFYGKYCNKLTQGEGQGTYRLDTENNRLTWSYRVNGMGMTSNWKLKNVTKYQFVQYSDVATLTYGKIVDTYNMNGGDSKAITFSELSVQGYESTNEHIATVSSDGLVTATGEKGTAYIKVKCLEADVYVKIIVEGDYADLWIDYSNLLECSHDEMVSLLGAPDLSSQNGILKYNLYSYNTPLHNILKGLGIAISTVNRRVNQVALNLREGIPQEDIQSYLDAHYYHYELGTEEGRYYYTTSPTLNTSRAIYVYEPEKHLVAIYTREDFKRDTGLGYWPDFTDYCFGMTSSQLQAQMEKKGYSLLPTTDFGSQPSNGNVKYSYDGYNYTSIVEFAFNQDNVVSEFIIYSDYPASEETTALIALKITEDYEFSNYETYGEKKIGTVYYNQPKTIRVFQDNHKVIFTDLSKPTVDWHPGLGIYWKGLGMDKNTLTNEFGNYSTVQSSINALTYYIKDRYVQSVNFLMDESNNTVKTINLFLDYAINSDMIRDYLNARYTFAEKDGQVERWFDAEKAEDATMRISFYPEEKVIVYGYPPKSFAISNYLDCIGLRKSQIQETITSWGGEWSLYGSQVCYTNPSESGMKAVWFSFDANTYKCNRISIQLNESGISEQEIVSMLDMQLEQKYGFEGLGYKYTSKDGKFGIFYSVQSGVIEISLE